MKLSKLKAYLLCMLATFAVLHSTAFAYGIAPVNPNDTLASVRISAVLVQGIIGIFLPLVVGFVTTLKDSSFTKGMLQLVLNAISSFIVQYTMLDGSVVFSKSTFFVFLTGCASSIVFYFNAWRGKGLTSSLFTKKVTAADGSVTHVVVPGKLALVGRT